jgi:hypothetical protein
MPPKKPRKTAPPPAGLTGAGLTTWKRIVGEFDFRSDELRVLEAACATETMIERLVAELGDGPATVRGSRGQQVVHPVVAELRHPLLALGRVWRQLGIPDDDDVAERKAQDRSTSARAAAEARWKR